MQVLDRAGVGTLWSICKTKFALSGHTHTKVGDDSIIVYPMSNNEVNFGGSNNSDTIFFGYRAMDSRPIPTNFVFGGIGTATLTAAKFKGALEGNASTASNASKVNGHTVNSDVPSGAKFTDTNTWRGIQDNLTSTSKSESLSANQGRVLKDLVDGKANSSHTHSWSQISGAPATATRWPSWGEVTGKPSSFTPSSHTHDWSQVTGKPELKSWSDTKSYIDSSIALSGGGIMIHTFNFTPQNTTIKLDENRDGAVLVIVNKSNFGSESKNCIVDASEFMARKAGNAIITINTVSYEWGIDIKPNKGGVQYTETSGNSSANGFSPESIQTNVDFGITISKGGDNGSIAWYRSR